MVLGRVLSQGEIDNLLGNLLEDKTVLPVGGSEPEASVEFAEPAVPAGIAAFKAKVEAAKAARESE